MKSRCRSWTSASAAVLLPAALMLAGQATASAAPNFQVPFRCGVTGMPVITSAPGTVSKVANEGSTIDGRWIEVDHGSGWTTRHAHLSTQAVSVGQSAGAGKQLGTAGATGEVTGPH